MKTISILAAAAVLTLAGCDQKVTDPPPPDLPEPGVLTVELATPNADDRAVMVFVTGPDALGQVTAANTAYLLFARKDGNSVRAAVFGPLASGPLLRLEVPDVGRASAYSASVLQVADEGNRLRPADGYAARVVR